MFTGPPAFPGRATPSRGQQVFTLDLAALDVSRRALLCDSPAVRLSKRFMNQITKHESRNTAFFRPGLRSMKIMVREMSLIRGLGAPAKEMSFPHLLALFKDLSCPLLPTIARHCPLLPAKKMSQALVASQYGRGSRGPGRVPRAAPRQPGCTVEPTNHEPRSFLARGASRREFRVFTIMHETRVTNHGLYRRPVAASLSRPPGSRGMARLRAAIARPARGGVGGEPVSLPR